MASQYGASFPVERAKVEAVELTSQGIETTAARGYRVCRWIKQSCFSAIPNPPTV